MDLVQASVETDHHAEPPLARGSNEAAERAARPDQVAGSIAQVIGAFERALRRAPIAAGDDFFELGGDSITAVALTLELEERTGIRLPITTLFDAATPAALAALLDRGGAHPGAPAPSAVVPLKPGTGGPCVFLAPGAGGHPLELLRMAKLVETAVPIYGLRAPGLDGQQAPAERIEDMAAYYVPHIRAVQPRGPYLMVGYSIGGLTCIEIARLLIAAGETVSLVALLDTALPRKTLPLRVKLRIWARRARHHAARIAALRGRDVLPYLVARVPALRDDLGAGSKAAPDARSDPSYDASVIAKGMAAMMRYRLRYLPAPLTFIEASGNRTMQAHPDLVWQGMAPDLSILRVSGDHWTMLGTHGSQVAACLSACIRRALETPPP